MQTSFIFALAAATTVLGECFTGGERWASQDAEALAGIGEACEFKFSQLSFSEAEASRGACFNIDGGRFVSLNLEYIGTDASRTPTSGECYDGFSKEVSGCEYGGSTSYTNWKYTSVLPSFKS